MKKQAFMKHIVLLAAMLLLVFGSTLAVTSRAAADEATMTVDDAAAVLKNFDQSIQVKSVEPAPIAGLTEVIVTVKGEVGIVYIDSARKHVVLGSIVDVMSKANLTKEKFEAVKANFEPKIDFASIPLDDAVVLGDAKAKHKVIVFDDPS